MRPVNIITRGSGQSGVKDGQNKDCWRYFRFEFWSGGVWPLILDGFYVKGSISFYNLELDLNGMFKYVIKLNTICVIFFSFIMLLISAWFIELNGAHFSKQIVLTRDLSMALTSTINFNLSIIWIVSKNALTRLLIG